MKVTLLAITPNAECLVTEAFKICTQASNMPVQNIKKWIGRGHESPIEHSSATFRIEGVSRACSHQIVRHRIASYSQKSQRYVEETGPEFVVPVAIGLHEAADALFAAQCASACSEC